MLATIMHNRPITTESMQASVEVPMRDCCLCHCNNICEDAGRLLGRKVYWRMVSCTGHVSTAARVTPMVVVMASSGQTQTGFSGVLRVTKTEHKTQA